MIKGYMMCDLKNELARKYMKVALKSFECVSDIFEIEVIQCITPNALLPILKDKYVVTQTRSPGEIAAMHSHYRMVKRLAAGEKFWIMEHDAYLINEETFRMLLSKWETFPVAEIGTSNEMYTMWQSVATEYATAIEAGTPHGPMSTLHKVAQSWCVRNNPGRAIYWPSNWKKDPRWVNVTGVGRSVNEAYGDPAVMIHSAVTQVVDEKYGGTVQDRKNPRYCTDGEFDITKVYTKDLHPDSYWVDLDSII
tara:strand:+ start:15821 stop:16573 length:753 start_codon:yes stop_codon:yes gene_type:complete